MRAHHDEELSFRPMTLEDLALLHRWLAEPHVAEWWGQPEPHDAMADKYRPRLDGTDPVSVWVMEVEAQPVGFVQWYAVSDASEWFEGVEIPPGTVGVDLAIGEVHRLGAGLGGRLLLEFCHHVLRALAPDCPEVWIDPNPRNERARRAFAAAGFRDTGVDLPDPDHPGELRRLMRMAWPGPALH
jgi:RimJ/RimL family protein N-acetyltransferase